MDKIIEPQKQPLLFEEFFALGEEASSPFLTPSSRNWGVNLSLRSSIVAACLLAAAFALSFHPSTLSLSYFLLMGVYFLAGIPSLIESIEDLAAFEINIDVLMTLAAFSSVIIGSSMEGGLLLVLFALSGSMEDFVTNKAKDEISSLHKLSPTRASVIEQDGRLIERSIKDIPIGTLILIKSGGVVPLDGTVVDGISSVNLGHITGENQPITKKAGDEVPAGARNLEGTLTLSVTRTSADSTIARIIQLVTQAQEERPVLQRWFDRLSRGYAITLIFLAFLFAITMPFVLGLPFFGREGSIYRALAFLIAASPCALILAIPIAYLSAIGACARQGILLKGGITLDALAQCVKVVFDKTGTLTTGDLMLEEIVPLKGASSVDLAQAEAVAYALEKNAMHPIARAVVAYGNERLLPVIPLKEFKAIPGYGLSASAQLLEGERFVYIGRPDHVLTLVTEELAQEIREKLIRPQERGEVVAALLIGDQGFLLRFRDALRPHIKEALEELREEGLQEVMLTGDHEASASQVALALGIREYYANLTPEDKLHHISFLCSKEDVAMIGDGVNDAPSLARATVGICMGKVGSTPAIDAADVVLLHDNIERVGWLMRKAHQTKRIVKQNLALATLAICVASLPALAGIVPLWLAVILHEGGTVLVGLNGLRLLRA